MKAIFAVLGFLLLLAIPVLWYGTIIYVAMHFIGKFW